MLFANRLSCRTLYSGAGCPVLTVLFLYVIHSVYLWGSRTIILNGRVKLCVFLPHTPLPATFLRSKRNIFDWDLSSQLNLNMERKQSIIRPDTPSAWQVSLDSLKLQGHGKVVFVPDDPWTSNWKVHILRNAVTSLHCIGPCQQEQVLRLQ